MFKNDFISSKTKKSSMDYSKKKLNELRDVCKEFKLKSSGTKKDMINRLKHYHFLQKKVDKNVMKLYKYKNDYYRPLQSFKKIYSFLIKKTSGEIIGKLNNQTDQIEDLEKEDIKYCIEYNYPFSIPIHIKGEHDLNRVRNVIEEDEDEEEFDEEI